MQEDIEELVTFLNQQKVRHAAHFPAIEAEKLLTFMGTTSLAGARAALGICPVLRLEAASPGELRVHLRGPLPRPPESGECITVHLTRLDQYQGFQVKSPPLEGPHDLERLATSGTSEGEVVVHATRIFTVHHSPYTMKFFESIPFEEVLETVGALRYALVGVGENANVSPRFVFHTEVEGGKAALYHGDGLALKTYMNLKTNRNESRLVLDLDDYSGYVLSGEVEEFERHQHPVAHDRITDGFAAGGWGKPSRTFRLLADRWERIAPTGPATRGRPA